MAAASRLADVCTGHPRGPSRPCIQGSPNVFINNRNALRVGDAWAGHVHSGIQSTGARTVYVNGRALGRVADAISCGSLVATGSPNVFCSN